MDTIAIGTALAAGEVREEVGAAFRPLQEAGVRIEIEEQARGPWTFLGCRFDGERGDLAQVSRRSVAAALAELIACRWQEALLRKLVSTHYSYFSQEEQGAILAGAVRRLSCDGQPAPVRRGRILARLQDCLERTSTLVVDGFVTFRCQDYVAELETALDQAVDDFLLEREYQEFLNLLRHFADTQEPRHELVHAVVGRDGRFQLSGSDGAPLNNRALDDLAAELATRDVAVEDLLISALISLAPRRVVLHREGTVPRGDSLATLEAVFGQRLSLCPGCQRCRGREST